MTKRKPTFKSVMSRLDRARKKQSAAIAAHVAAKRKYHSGAAVDRARMRQIKAEREYQDAPDALRALPIYK